MEELIYQNIGETVKIETLSSGMKVFVVEKPEFTKSFAVFTTNYGGADRRFKLGDTWLDTPAGIAHFLEHKMFDTEDGNALNILASSGASPNAFTSTNQTSYHFECTEGFNENLKTLLSFVSIPYFTKESVDKEQGIIGQEIQMTDDSPDYAIYFNLLACLYENNPIKESIIGTIESISHITDKTLYDCHKVFYHPSNMVLAVVGNVKAEDVFAIAKEILPADVGEKPIRDYGTEPNELPFKKEIAVNMAVSETNFFAGSKVTPAKKGKEMLEQAVLAQLSLSYIMGSSSPFYTKLYSEGLLDNSFVAEFEQASDVSTIIFGGESRDYKAVLSALAKEVEALDHKSYDKEHFENCKKSLYGKLLRGLGSFSSMALNLSEGAFSEYNSLDAFEILMGIKANEVIDFIKENLKEEKLAVSVVNPLAI